MSCSHWELKRAEVIYAFWTRLHGKSKQEQKVNLCPQQLTQPCRRCGLGFSPGGIKLVLYHSVKPMGPNGFNRVLKGTVAEHTGFTAQGC